MSENFSFHLNKFSQLLIGIILFLILLSIFFWVDHQDYFSSHFYYQAAVKTFLLVIMTLVVKRIIHFAFFVPYFIKNGHHPPSLIKHSIDFSLFFILSILVLIFAFYKDISTLLAASSIIDASVAFALRNLILDIFAGFILDTYDNFKVGDWLFFGRSEVGKVVEMNWRTSILKDKHNWLYHIPNGKLIREGYRVVTPFYQEKFELQLPRNFPLDVAERLLKGATLSLSLNHEKECTVLAKEFDKEDIIYEITYVISDFDHRTEAKNALIRKIVQILHICDFDSQDSIIDFKKLLKTVDIFQILSEEEQEVLLHSLHFHFYPQGNTIVTQAEEGSSMYLIAEGAVKVSIQDPADPSSSSIDLAILSCGDFFGDIALFTGRPRTATVTSLTDVVIYEIKKEDFEPILKNNLQLVEKLTEIIEKRIQGKDKALSENKSKSISSQSILFKEIMKFFGFKP